jgi:hypothetical protein
MEDASPDATLVVSVLDDQEHEVTSANARI